MMQYFDVSVMITCDEAQEHHFMTMYEERTLWLRLWSY